MAVTDQVLGEIYRRSAGDMMVIVDAAPVAATLGLAEDELRSALRALDLTGLIAFTTDTGTGSVRMTILGIDRCRQHDGQ